MIMAAVPGVAAELLTADFDTEVVDQTVPTGGAAAGQPQSVDSGLGAVVRATPFATPSLELTDQSTTGARTVTFQFLGDEEVTTGVVEITVNLWFPAVESFSFLVREADSSAFDFLDMTFADNGGVFISDQAGFATSLPSYPLGRSVPLIVVYDLDAGTYDLSLDGSLVLDDRAHGVVGRGIGRLLIGVNFDSDTDGTFFLDDLHVVRDPVVFSDGFEAGDLSGWSTSVS